MNEDRSEEEAQPQLVIVLATFTPTGGGGEPVPKFGEPMIMPDVREALLELGWREPEPPATPTVD